MPAVASITTKPRLSAMPMPRARPAWSIRSSGRWCSCIGDLPGNGRPIGGSVQQAEHLAAVLASEWVLGAQHFEHVDQAAATGIVIVGPIMQHYLVILLQRALDLIAYRKFCGQRLACLQIF